MDDDELAKLDELRREKVISKAEAAELARLVRLRDKGTITPQEYDGRKYNILTADHHNASTEPKERRSVFKFVAVTAINVILTVAAISIAINAGVYYLTGGLLFTPSDFVTCDSSAVKQALGDAIGNGVYSHLLNVKLLYLSNIIEISHDKVTSEWVCAADAYLNTGQVQIQFRVTMVDRNARRFIVTIISSQPH